MNTITEPSTAKDATDRRIAQVLAGFEHKHAIELAAGIYDAMNSTHQRRHPNHSLSLVFSAPQYVCSQVLAKRRG